MSYLISVGLGIAMLVDLQDTTSVTFTVVVTAVALGINGLMLLVAAVKAIP